MKAPDSVLEEISGYQSIAGAKINRDESNRNVSLQQRVDTAAAYRMQSTLKTPARLFSRDRLPSARWQIRFLS